MDGMIIEKKLAGQKAWDRQSGAASSKKQCDNESKPDKTGFSILYISMETESGKDVFNASF